MKAEIIISKEPYLSDKDYAVLLEKGCNGQVKEGMHGIVI